jgi:hypothetical protein
VLYRIDGIADGRFGELSSARFVALCERTLAFRGAMRALADAIAGDEGDELSADLLDEDLADEVELQDLGDLQLGMEVLDDARSNGAGLAGEGARADA